MNKKIVSLFTLIVFTVFTFSCVSTKIEKIETVLSWKSKKVIISAVLKASGEKIEFKKPKGKIVKDMAKGGVIVVVGGVINEAGIRKKVSIPISEIELVWVKQIHESDTVLVVAVLIATPLYIIDRARKASCPFIYSFDGDRYIFDAEPYAGAVCEVLKRMEWCGLQHLKEVNEEYRILVTNEMDETQYTDELKLLVVDHPRGVQVVPDTSGGIHTITNPLIPIRAYDQKGNDLTSDVCENDWVSWFSREEGKNPDKKEDLRDELIFEFPKPRDASRAKLLFNGCNTLWGSESIKRYLELYGKKVFEWYDEMKNFGPAFFKMTGTDLREELYSLQIRVETEKGWKSRGIILGGPPLVSEDKVYILNLDDVPGDTLKIKLTPPAPFWKINYLAVDYSGDLPVKVTEIKAIKATDNKGQDVEKLLAKNDNNYLEMPNIGDSAELIFQSPAHLAGMERTVILKAGGYYDIHLKAEGEPQLEILDRIHSEPGFAVQYAFKEYLKWKKEVMEKINHKK